MKILFLHGWHSVPGGVKPTYLAEHGHEVINPALDDDFDAALVTAQSEFDRHRPDVIVGSSRGGAVAMNLDRGTRPLVLLCRAWKKYGSAKSVKPVTFSCEDRLSLKPEDIARQILDVSKWQEFKGYAFIPGVKVAKFEIQTPSIVGSRIRVTNTDGSGHVEEIIEWQPDQRLTLMMKDFSPPLSHLATGFQETWELNRLDHATEVTRTFKLHARSSLTRIVLVAISWFLKKAIARHLRQMRYAPPK